MVPRHGLEGLISSIAPISTLALVEGKELAIELTSCSASGKGQRSAFRCLVSNHDETGPVERMPCIQPAKSHLPNNFIRMRLRNGLKLRSANLARSALVRNLLKWLVPRGGFEPPRDYSQRILSPFEGILPDLMK
jgi:hypothetical protein